jgi:Transposase, Mutator family
VLHITTEVPARMELARSCEKKKQSLRQHRLEKMKTWINSLLEGERDEFLGRDRHVPLDEGRDNYRNGYRPRRINFFGFGESELKVPRDRQGEFTSQWLPERKGQDPELEDLVGEAPGAPVRFQADLAHCRAGHDRTRGLAPAILARPALQVSLYRRRQLSGAH